MNASFWRQKSISLWDGPERSPAFCVSYSQSLRGQFATLKTDHIDVYQMHHIDRHTPWEEIWQAMELLVQQGKVLYIGSSNFAGWDIATAQSVATARHFLGLVAEQSLYNLTARTIELELIPACRHFGLGLIPWSPLAGGLLGGVLKRWQAGAVPGPRLPV